MIPGLFIGACFSITACQERIVLGPGELAPASPQQSAAADLPFDHAGYRLAPQANFEATGKVLAKRRYRWDDLADLVPWDLGLGWGVLSDEAALETVRFSQGDRFLFRRDWARRIDAREADRTSANIHVIPADSGITAAIEALPVGAIVRLKGLLVDAHHLATPRRYFTSLSRDDTGGGACEILYLTGLKVLAPEALLAARGR
jgi:hypothetical protein